MLILNDLLSEIFSLFLLCEARFGRINVYFSYFGSISLQKFYMQINWWRAKVLMTIYIFFFYYHCSIKNNP
jgi:hypothetical protein